MLGRRVARALYNRAARAPVLRRPVAAIRRNPAVRAFARRHAGMLLDRGSTWANIDGSLRLLAEDEQRRAEFGPWPGDQITELLYWQPFVRWAQSEFALDGAGDALVFPAAPVQALVDEYRGGAAAPRPLLKRTLYTRLEAPADHAAEGLPERYVALALGWSEAFPETEADRAAAADLVSLFAASGPVVALDEETAGEGVLQPLRGVPEERRQQAQHALLAGSAGLVASWSGLALLGALSGVPVLAVRSAAGQVVEPDVDMALRVVSELSGSLMILGIDDLYRLFTLLGSTERQATVDSPG